jgi:hypothetical protein
VVEALEDVTALLPTLAEMETVKAEPNTTTIHQIMVAVVSADGTVEVVVLPVTVDQAVEAPVTQTNIPELKETLKAVTTAGLVVEDSAAVAEALLVVAAALETQAALDLVGFRMDLILTTSRTVEVEAVVGLTQTLVEVLEVEVED